MSRKEIKRDCALPYADRERLGERLCRALDIVPDALWGEGLIEIRGRGSVSVQGGGKILVYTPERIKIALSSGSVSIYGSRLNCTSYHAGSVCVDGRIGSVVFEEE